MRGKALVFGFSFAVVALMCLAHEPAAQTQQGTQPSQTERVPPDMLRGDMTGGGMMGGGSGMMGGAMGTAGGGMMCGHMGGSGMMGGMYAEHRRGPRVLMRMIFSLMDADGDGSISLQEFQAAHERIFKGIDQNKDGRVTMEEMRIFMGAAPAN
jgi:EF hand domain-containing protein